MDAESTEDGLVLSAPFLNLWFCRTILFELIAAAASLSERCVYYCSGTSLGLLVVCSWGWLRPCCGLPTSGQTLWPVWECKSD